MPVEIWTWPSPRRLIRSRITGTYEPDTQPRLLKVVQADGLRGVDLSHSDLFHADFSFHDLTGANLAHRKLMCACFEGAILKGANLQGAKLVLADLSDAILEDADMQRVYALEATMRRARFWGADLRGAILGRVFLCGADLRGARLEGTVLKGSYYDEGTQWPEGFDVVEAGCKHISTYRREDRPRHGCSEA
jgi:hypothetical protein